MRTMSYATRMSGRKVRSAKTSSNSDNRGAIDGCLVPRTAGVATRSCPSPWALLAPIDRQLAEGHNNEHHALPEPLHKVLHRARNEYNSMTAAGY